MTAGLLNKSFKDGAGNPFNGQMFDDGSTNIVPIAVQTTLSGPNGSLVPVEPTHPLPSYSPGGLFDIPAAFSRPLNSNTYNPNARVADATAGATVLEFTNVMRAVGESSVIQRLRIRSNRPTGVAALLNVQFRVHFFRVLPTVNVSDGGTFTTSNILAVQDVTGYVGTIDVTFDKGAVVGARGVGVPAVGSGIIVSAAGATGHETSIWAVVETLGGFAGVSGETFTLTIEGARS